MSKYVNLFSEFVKEVAQRLNIPYDKAMKKIETNKALQSEWRGIKSERKELFVPVRTVSRSSAQSTGMAEIPAFQPEADPLIALRAEYALGEPARQEAQAEMDFAINRRRVQYDRRRDRAELQRGLVLGANHAVVDDNGDIFMNMFGDEDDDGVAAVPPQFAHQLIEDIPIARLQAAIRGKLQRTEAKRIQQLQTAIEGQYPNIPANIQRIAGNPEERARVLLIADLERRVANLPRKDRERAKEDIVVNQMGRDQQLLLGYDAELKRQMLEARRADEERAQKQARAEQLLINVAKARRAKADGTAKKKETVPTINVPELPAGLSKKERATLATQMVSASPNKKSEKDKPSTTGVGLKKKIKGGASASQIGSAAVMRNWVGNPLHDELNDITHSNDPDAKASNRFAWVNHGMEYFQKPDPRANTYLQDAADVYPIAVDILHSKYDKDISPAEYARLHPAIKNKYTKNVDDAIREFEDRIIDDMYAGNIPPHIERKLSSSIMKIYEVNKIIPKIRDGFDGNIPAELIKVLTDRYPADHARHQYNRLSEENKGKITRIFEDLRRGQKTPKQDANPRWILTALMPDDREEFRRINGFGLETIRTI